MPGLEKKMIAADMLMAYCLTKPGAHIDYPFGGDPVCVKVKGKIFAEIYLKPGNYKITLKCDPLLAAAWRQEYPSAVTQGYHCPPSQQPHRNTVWVERMEEGLLRHMVDHSYDLVVKGLPRAGRDALEQNG